MTTNSSGGAGGAGSLDDSYDAGLDTIEPGPGEASSPSPSADAQAEAAAAALRMDMLGVAGDGGPLEAPPKRVVNSRNLLVLLVAMASVGAVATMRLLGMGPRSSLGEVSSLKDEAEKTHNFDPSVHQKWLVDLSASRITAQVPSDQVQRNPFLVEGVIQVKATPVAAPKGETPEQREARLKAERERQDAERAGKVQAALATLSVNSIVAGGMVPVARINGDLVRIGDVVAEYFTVKDITTTGVVLEIEGGKTFTLDIPETRSGSSPGGPRRGPSTGGTGSPVNPAYAPPGSMPPRK